MRIALLLAALVMVLGAMTSRAAPERDHAVVKASIIGVGTSIAAGADTLEVWLENDAGRVLGRNHLEAADFLLWKQ
jgi:hypothetical protein